MKRPVGPGGRTLADDERVTRETRRNRRTLDLEDISEGSPQLRTHRRYSRFGKIQTPEEWLQMQQEKVAKEYERMLRNDTVQARTLTYEDSPSSSPSPPPTARRSQFNDSLKTMTYSGEFEGEGSSDKGRQVVRSTFRKTAYD